VESRAGLDTVSKRKIPSLRPESHLDHAIVQPVASQSHKGQLSGIELGYGLDDRGLVSRQGLGIFLLTTVFRPALGPTQSPIQCVPGALSLGGKETGV
jgi:hypothetical protein